MEKLSTGSSEARCGFGRKRAVEMEYDRDGPLQMEPGERPSAALLAQTVPDMHRQIPNDIPKDA